MDMSRQVPETLLEGIKAGFAAEHGKPGCPHVGRDEEGVLGGVEGDFEQIPGVETEDRSAVRGDVADPAQPCVEPFHRPHVGHENQVVSLPCLPELLVYTADLTGKQEPGRPRARRGKQGVDGGTQVLFEGEETLLGVDEVFAQL